MRSSQCPGTARSAASAGRALIMIRAARGLAPYAGAGTAKRPAAAKARAQLAP